jgi:hypothetical protein
MLVQPDNYSNAQHVRKPDGAIILDGRTVADTVQCCHCGGHFIPIKGSGVKRGFCTYCGKPTCGESCSRCLPFEQWLKLVESKK